MGNCGSCGAVASEADFCTSCGAPLRGTDGESATELLESPTRVGGATGSSSASDEDESTSQTVDASDPDAGAGSGSRPRWRSPMVLLSVGVVAVLLIGGLIFFRHMQDAAAVAKREQQTAENLTAELTKLSAARNTADIRAVAQTAQEQQQALSGSAAKNERIAANAAAFGELAQLRNFNGDTLATWPQRRAAIDAAVRKVSLNEKSLDPSAVLVAVDGMVSKAETQLAEYQSNAAAVTQEKAAKRSALDAYKPSASAAIKTYSNIMNAAKKMFDTADRAGSSASLSSIATNLHTTLADRSRARDRFAAISEPAALASYHTEVEAAMTQVIGGISDLSSGVDRTLASCTGSGCALSRVSAYSTFSSVSSTNTGRFNEAVKAWDAAVTSYSAQIDAIQPPAKPNV